MFTNRVLFTNRILLTNNVRCLSLPNPSVIVPEGIIHGVVSVSAKTRFIRYFEHGPVCYPVIYIRLKIKPNSVIIRFYIYICITFARNYFHYHFQNYLPCNSFVW